MTIESYYSLCLVLFAIALLIGQTIIAIGGTANSYNTILFGRIVTAYKMIYNYFLVLEVKLLMVIDFY
jgi:hypothetical protein